VYADITWVAQVGGDVPDSRRAVFDVVARARDAVVADVRERIAAGATVLGFELDRIARGVVEDAGHGTAFVHRTGHSLSPGDAVHGLGANLDDLETHDTRPLRPGLGFTVEPGVYLPEFGVRLEIDVYLGPDGPIVTSPVQTAPVLLGA
jgi:Xaa-Pro dipeptidase